MPGEDGISCTRRLREEQGVTAPILAFTADASAETRARCLSVGMDGVLTKPVSLEKLDVALRRHGPT
jgi:two-component system capsular synthesis sensor histidine kinase RcsC